MFRRRIENAITSRRELNFVSSAEIREKKNMEKNECENVNESMGYRNKEKALYTLKHLDGRDTSYQYRAINHYCTSAKKTLKITKDEEKIKNISEAIEIFDEWLRDYRENNRGKTNFSYLPLEIVEAFKPLASIYRIFDTEFYEAYKKLGGDYKAMRNERSKAENARSNGITWDIERNKMLREITSNAESSNFKWYETSEDDPKEHPSREHTRCILLAYSPNPSKLKALVPKISQILQKLSRTNGMMDVDEAKEDRERKRSRSSSDEDEEPSTGPRKTRQKVSEDSVDMKKREETASALSFKDEEKALRSIESLNGRDVLYQYHAISGLAKRANRVISCTKDERKIEAMRAAVEVLENWLTDYNVNHRSKENFGYLPLELVRAYEPLAEKHDIEIPDFIRAYEQVGGDYKKLRSVKVPDGDVTWDIERNRRLGKFVRNIKETHKQWFETDAPLRGLPTKEHTECIMWGFSHEPAKLKKTLALLNEKL